MRAWWAWYSWERMASAGPHHPFLFDHDPWADLGHRVIALDYSLIVMLSYHSVSAGLYPIWQALLSSCFIHSSIGKIWWAHVTKVTWHRVWMLYSRAPATKIRNAFWCDKSLRRETIQGTYGTQTSLDRLQREVSCNILWSSHVCVCVCMCVCESLSLSLCLSLVIYHFFVIYLFKTHTHTQTHTHTNTHTHTIFPI